MPRNHDWQKSRFTGERVCLNCERRTLHTRPPLAGCEGDELVEVRKNVWVRPTIVDAFEAVGGAK